MIEHLKATNLEEAHAPREITLRLAAATKHSYGRTFPGSVAAATTAFFLIGILKGHAVGRSKLLAGIETLRVGSAAASMAFLAGAGLQGLIGP